MTMFFVGMVAGIGVCMIMAGIGLLTGIMSVEVIT